MPGKHLIKNGYINKNVSLSNETLSSRFIFVLPRTFPFSFRLLPPQDLDLSS